MYREIAKKNIIIPIQDAMKRSQKKREKQQEKNLLTHRVGGESEKSDKKGRVNEIIIN